MLSNLTQHNGAFSTSSDYQSSQFLAGLEWARHWVDVEGTVLDVLLGLEINTELIEAYDESQLFEWDSRDITQVQPRIEVGYTSKPPSSWAHLVCATECELYCNDRR